MGEYAATHGPAEKQAVAVKLAQDIQTEQDPLVRIVLIRTLGKIPNETAAAVLYAGIKDPDPEVRMEVCTAWGKRVHESLTKGGGLPPGPTEDAAVQVLAGCSPATRISMSASPPREPWAKCRTIRGPSPHWGWR